MPYKYPAAVRGSIIPLILNNFSGGWNPREAPSEVGDTESPTCLNVTLDERGGVVKRLGLERLGSGTTLVNSPSNLFFWKTKEITLVQDGKDLRKTTDFTSFPLVHTFSTDDMVTMCDFNGNLYVIHPVDKLFIWDGTAAMSAVAGSPRGSCIAVWQNKVWVAGDPTAPARVYASPTGHPELPWELTIDFNDIREKDGLPITALGAGQGMDISGRPGLLVFKLDSTHRINESRSNKDGAGTGTAGGDVWVFGAYTTLHSNAGAAGCLAVASTPSGQIAFINHRGIYVSDGVNPPFLASGKLQPFFSDLELNLNRTDMWCAGVYQDRVVFSLTREPGQQFNNYTLEYNPAMGWIVPHDFGCSCYTEDLTSGTRRLRGGSPTAGKIFDVFSTGADDGVPIAAHWQSRWFEPAGGYMIRMRRLAISGRGRFGLYTKADYTLGQGILSQFVGTQFGGTWGVSTWGEDVWGTRLYESYKDFYSLGVARSVAFELFETSDQHIQSPPVNEDGSTPDTGNFALYGLKLDYVRLGYT